MGLSLPLNVHFVHYGLPQICSKNFSLSVPCLLTHFLLIMFICPREQLRFMEEHFSLILGGTFLPQAHTFFHSISSWGNTKSVLGSDIREWKRTFCWDLGHRVFPPSHDPRVWPQEAGTGEGEARARPWQGWESLSLPWHRRASPHADYEGNIFWIGWYWSFSCWINASW